MTARNPAAYIVPGQGPDGRRRCDMARKSKKAYLAEAASTGGTASAPAPAKPAVYRAGLYARLSEESEANRERATIGTQMELLRRFVAENEGMAAVKEYSDVSCTGTNFDRPGFGEMMRDVADGLVNCIIVKDLSRLGRNYVETGNYIERVFPFFGVRFIAVTDGYDSERPGAELLMPLKNMVNEMYSRDLSRKIKSAFHAMWDRGEYPSGRVPYGYVHRDRRLCPDEAVIGIVQEIFRMFLAGESLKGIARHLSGKTMNPRAYRLVSWGREVPEGMAPGWNYSTVRGILSNPAYKGASVHHKTERRGGKQVFLPKEEWIIVEGTHEPLVSREDFDRVQAALAKNVEEFHATHGENGFDHARFNFMGKRIVCADCGKAMAFRTQGKEHTYRYFRCKSYNNNTKGTCGSHKVAAEAVADAVFSTVREHMELCINTEETVRRLNAEAGSVKRYDACGKEADRIRKELQRAAEIKAGLFEDYRDGLLDSGEYMQASREYASRVGELSARLDEMLGTQAAYSREYHVDRDWKAAVEKFLGSRELTKEMVDAFVEKVLVHEDGSLEIHLAYDDMLRGLRGLEAEREAEQDGE